MTTASALRIATRIAGRVLVLVLVGFVVAGLTLLVILPRATHGAALTVLTGSMTPTIPVGSVVIDRPVDPGTLRVGDVATYQKSAGKAEFITHRIIAINTKTAPVTFTFKGDANRGPDLTPVPATAIRGKVWFHVAHVGTIRDSIQSRGMRPIALLLTLVALAVYAARQLRDGLRDRRRTTTAASFTPPCAGRDDDSRLRAVFHSDAFDGIHASVVAHLLRGDYTPLDEGFVLLGFTGSAARLAAIADTLEPFAPIQLEVQPAADTRSQTPAASKELAGFNA